MAKMTEDDLLGFLEAEQADAFAYNDGEVSEARQRAMRDYLRMPYGTEQEGRSQVVSSDVFDAVEGMLPDLVEVFVASDKAVVFDPVGQEDEQGAKQATDACNHVFYKQNNGFLILYTAAKDALLLRTGAVKWWWDVRRTPSFTTYARKRDMEIAIFQMTNPDAEIIEANESEPEEGVQPQMDGFGQPVKLYDLKVKTVKNRGQVRICAIPPDELEVSARHNSILLDDCPYVAHKSQKTLSELTQAGFDVDDADIKAAQESVTQDREFYDTFRGRDSNDVAHTDEASRRGWIREEYVLIDFDGDGIAERRKIIRLGKKILENVEFSHVPIAAWTPYLLTHKFDGMSAQDLTTDFQRIGTDILRAQIDNLILANNQETVVLTDSNGSPRANIDDLLNRRPGGIIREYTQGAVRPYTERWQGIEAMPFIEQMERAKEKRTGYAPTVKALDADALNKTAFQVSKEEGQTERRKKLMARMMAETLVAPMFRGIFKTLTDYCMEKLSFKLNGEFVQMDPQEWREGYSLTINVGIGSGDTMQQMQALNAIAAAQAGLAQSPFGPVLIDAEKIFNTQQRLAEAAGFKNPAEFWLQPQKGPDGKIAMPPPGKPPQVTLKEMDIQAEAQKFQAQAQNDQMRFQAETQMKQAVEQMKAEADQRRTQMTLELQAANDARDSERETMKAGYEAQLAVRQLELDRYRVDADNNTRIQVALINAQKAMQQAAEPQEGQPDINRADNATTLTEATQ